MSVGRRGRALGSKAMTPLLPVMAIENVSGSTHPAGYGAWPHVPLWHLGSQYEVGERVSR